MQTSKSPSSGTASGVMKKPPPYVGPMVTATISVSRASGVFAPSNGHRIVLSTNVAETSLTVPGIRYVIAAGLARIKPLQILPPFFVGKFVSDAVMLFSGRYALSNSVDLVYGSFSWKGIATIVTGLVLLAAVLFLDWRLLLEKRKFQVNFHIWK